jgi:hypothetical protein
MLPWLEHSQKREAISAVILFLRIPVNKGKKKPENLLGE